MATITRAHKIRLHPTPEQEEYFRRAAGVSRFTYNWGLDAWQKQHQDFKDSKTTEKPTAMSLKKEFNAIKHTQYPFVEEVTKCATEQPFFHLEAAFKNFFAHRAKYPQFKNKKKSKPAFYLSNDQVDFGPNWMHIPKLGDFILKQREEKGETVQRTRHVKEKLSCVHMAEIFRYVTDHTPTEQKKHRHARKFVVSPHVKLIGVTISKDADWWFASIQVEIVVEPQQAPEAAVGVDVGLLRLATMSNGEEAENQRFLKNLLTKVRNLSRKLSRRTKGSKNWQRAKRQLARLHYRIRCMREDTLHKLLTYLVETFGFIGLEHLNIKGMMKNRKRARAIADAAWGKLIGMLQAKSKMHGAVLQLVDRFFPSTKLCHTCGHKWDTITEKDRVYICQNPDCGWQGDRDVNAAINILVEALRLAWIDQRVDDALVISAVSGIGLDGNVKVRVWRECKTSGAYS